VVTGVAALTFMNSTNSMVQLSTEPAMRGRVMAIRLAVALGTTPIGAPIVGWEQTDSVPDGHWALVLYQGSPQLWSRFTSWPGRPTQPPKRDSMNSHRRSASRLFRRPSHWPIGSASTCDVTVRSRHWQTYAAACLGRSGGPHNDETRGLARSPRAGEGGHERGAISRSRLWVVKYRVVALPKPVLSRTGGLVAGGKLAATHSLMASILAPSDTPTSACLSVHTDT